MCSTIVQNDNKMIRIDLIIGLLSICVWTKFSVVDGVFFNNDCPEFATFFEADNSTTDCNGAMPISTFGLKGDRFCDNVCAGVSHFFYIMPLECIHMRKKGARKRRTSVFALSHCHIKAIF